MLRKLPSIRHPTMEKGTPIRVDPRPVDPFLDTVTDITDLQGNVIFTGTRRQWQKWAREKEDKIRLSYGLTPRGGSTGKLRRKLDTADQLLR